MDTEVPGDSMEADFGNADVLKQENALLPAECRNESVEVMKFQSVLDRARTEESRCRLAADLEAKRAHHSDFDRTHYQQLVESAEEATQKATAASQAAFDAYQNFREKYADIDFERLLTIAEPFARRSEGMPNDPRGPIPGVLTPIARFVNGQSIELYPDGQSQPGVQRRLRGAGAIQVGERVSGGSESVESRYEGDDDYSRQTPTRTVPVFRVAEVTESAPGTGKLEVQLYGEMLEDKADHLVTELRANLDLEMWQRLDQAQIDKVRAERRSKRISSMNERPVELPPIVEEWTHPDGRQLRGEGWQHLAWDGQELWYEQGKISVQKNEYPYDRRYREEVARVEVNGTVNWNVNQRMQRYFPEILKKAVDQWAEEGDYGLNKE